MLEVFLSNQCDHCEWVEQALLNTKKEVRVWDCKRDIRNDTFYKAVERKDGHAIRRIQLPYGVPCMVDTSSEVPTVLVGAKYIAERIRGERTLFVPGRR